MNVAVIAGRIAKKDEVRYTKNAKEVLSFTVAVNRPFKKDETDFLVCTAWGATAENIYKYFEVGDQIIINGSIQIDILESNGETKYFTKIMVRSFDFGAKKRGASTSYKEKAEENYPEVETDELPF